MWAQLTAVTSFQDSERAQIFADSAMPPKSELNKALEKAIHPEAVRSTVQSTCIFCETKYATHVKEKTYYNFAVYRVITHIANCTARDEGLVALNAYLQKHKACEGQVTNNRVVVTFSTVIQVRAIRNWSVSVAKPLKCGGRPCCLCSSPSPLCSDHNGYMKGHLPLCDTRRLMYSRFVAILGAPTSAAALALAEESAPIDDWLENVRLLLIQSDYLQRLHTQEFSYIYANSSLDSVRAYNPNGGNFYYDEHHLYLRFNAHVSPLYTLDNMYRVGVAQSIRRREEKYATTEPAGSVRAVYICSGPTLYVYLMEAILILLFKNQLCSNVYEFISLVSAPRSIIFATLGRLALFMRDVLDHSKPSSLKVCLVESIIARAELDRGDIQAIRSILDAHERALDASVEQLSANGNEEAEEPKPTHAEREQKRRGAALKRAADEAAVIPQKAKKARVSGPLDAFVVRKDGKN